MSANLECLDCPFCGSNDIDVSYVGRLRNWVAGCRGCGAESGQSEYREAAVAAWNRRAPVKSKCSYCDGKGVVFVHGGACPHTGEQVDGHENSCPQCAETKRRADFRKQQEAWPYG